MNFLIVTKSRSLYVLMKLLRKFLKYYTYLCVRVCVCLCVCYVCNINKLGLCIIVGYYTTNNYLI